MQSFVELKLVLTMFLAWSANFLSQQRWQGVLMIRSTRQTVEILRLADPNSIELRSNWHLRHSLVRKMALSSWRMWRFSPARRQHRITVSTILVLIVLTLQVKVLAVLLMLLEWLSPG